MFNFIWKLSMEKVQISLKLFEKALNTLKESISFVNNKDYDEIYTIIRDSVIQRFEYTVELMWKTIKNFLKEVHWLECVSPKTCLKLAKKVWIIDNLEIYFKMINLRNITSHTYDETKADILVEQIEYLLPFIQKVYDEIVKVLK